eukprot:UN00161
MKIAVVSLLFGIALGSNSAWMNEINNNFDDLDYHTEFEDWKSNFGKTYLDNVEEAHHYHIFVENWEFINNHNLAKKYNYTMRVNQFTDMTNVEFLYYVHGTAKGCRSNRIPKLNADFNLEMEIKKADAPAAPTAIDWTNINGVSYVTPVKDQKNCGSCWAFSTVGSLESFQAIRDNKTGSAIQELSEQQLVDCTYAIPDGCQGGLQEDGFNYVSKNGGLCSEKEYPYTARDGHCDDKTCGTKYDSITGYKKVTKSSETALVDALAMGPIAVSVDAAGSGWQHYSGGVYSADCGTSLDHGVTGVGYGHESTGGDYWKIKNSWGTSWGMKGFMLICRNCNKNGNKGECGILEDNTYPVGLK